MKIGVRGFDREVENGGKEHEGEGDWETSNELKEFVEGERRRE